MDCILHEAYIFSEAGFVKKDVFVKDGIIFDIADNLVSVFDIKIFKLNNCFIFPGLTDVHVHLREPGFFYKETIKSGTSAAAHGGFTNICAMPNLNPVPDSMEHLNEELEIIARDAVVNVYPYGSITVGEKQEHLSDMAAIADKVIAFTDDGVGVSSRDMMRRAMLEAKRLGKMIVAHCEDTTLLTGGYIHDGSFAKSRGFNGISSESEWRQLERDLELVRETGCDYHVCHISTKESVELVRRAKAEGLPVSCETAPHYLVLSDEDLEDEGRFRMNPPIRSGEDRSALIEGIQDGTVDMIATDHAPHSDEEKSKGLSGSLNGVVGLETAFSILYTRLVKTGVITLERLIELMHKNPAKRFGIGTKLEIGASADLTVFDLDAQYNIDPEQFLSKGKSTPFEGEKVFGKCLLTMVNGRAVFIDNDVE